MGILRKDRICISEIREERNHWQRVTSASERLMHASRYTMKEANTVAEIQAANLLLRLSVEVITEDVERSFR
jgi:hypothetical protein